MFEKRDNSNSERLPDPFESVIDKLLSFSSTVIISCLIESPSNKMSHGGVLAMREFLGETNLAEDASFQNTNLNSMPSKLHSQHENH